MRPTKFRNSFREKLTCNKSDRFARGSPPFGIIEASSPALYSVANAYVIVSSLYIEGRGKMEQVVTRWV